MGLTYVDVPVFNTPATELFRVPVASVPDVPPVFLTVGYRADTLATVKAYTAGATSLRTAFNASGSTTICEIIYFGFKFYIGKSIAEDTFACTEVTMLCKVTFLNLNFYPVLLWKIG